METEFILAYSSRGSFYNYREDMAAGGDGMVCEQEAKGSWYILTQEDLTCLCVYQGHQDIWV